MPPTEVVIFADDDGSSPLVAWLDRLPAKVQDKCIARISRLRDSGHELRRPEADLLRSGTYELRIGYERVNYRILYFFHQRRAVVTHGLSKEARVPDREINLALRRKAASRYYVIGVVG